MKRKTNKKATQTEVEFKNTKTNFISKQYLKTWKNCDLRILENFSDNHFEQSPAYFKFYCN